MAGEDVAKAAKQDKGKKGKKDDKKPAGPSKPDRDAMEAEVAKLNAKIEECKAVIDGVKEKLDKRQEERKNNNNNDDKDEKKLKELKAATKKLSDERKKIFDEMSGHGERRDHVREQCDKMQKQVKDAGGCFTVEQVDKKVQQLEHYLSTTGLSLKEEKAVIADIKNLNNSKEAIGKLASFRDQRSALETAGRKFSSRLDANKKLLEAARAEQDAQFEICKQKRKADGEKNNVKALIASRNAARKEMDGYYDRRRKLHEDFKANQTAYRKFQDERWKAIRAREAEQQAQYAEEQRVFKLRKEEENAENLHVDLFASIEQLKFVLGKMSQQGDKPAEAAEEKLSAFADKERTLIGKAAKEMDDDIFNTKIAKKGKKGKRNKAKKAGNLKFDLKTLQEFESLKIQAPLTVESFEETIKLLDAKKLELEADKKKQHEARIAKLAELEKEQAAKASDNDGDEKKPAADAEDKPAAVEATA